MSEQSPPPPPSAPQPPVATAVPLDSPPSEVKKKGHLARNLLIGVVGLSLLLIIIIGVAAVGSKTTKTTTNTTPAAPNQSAPPPAATSAAPPAAVSTAPHTVGDTIKTTAGGSFAVLEYVDHFTSTNQFDKPPPGGFYAAIRIKACAGSSQPLDISPATFTLVEPDDSRIDESGSLVVGGKTPRLIRTTLQPSECVSGWVNYGVAARPKGIALSNSNLRWIVPAT